MWSLLNFDIQSFGEKPKLILTSVGKVIDCQSVEQISPELFRKIDAIIVRLGWQLQGKFLKKFNKLKVIASITTGLDHIDLKYCSKQGIKILSLKGETDFLQKITATPEMTWCLLLSLIRKLPSGFSSVLEGHWERNSFFGNELNNKSLGIIGFGRVGKILGRYGIAFGMNICAFDIQPIRFRDYPVKQVSLQELLSTSDVVSVHLPLEDSTYHLLGEEHFQQMKPSAYFLNTARGAIVDEEALLTALKSQTIAGAAVDVIENEMEPSHINIKHPLIQYASVHNNLIISPHIAGSTYESMEKTALFITNKLTNYIKIHA